MPARKPKGENDAPEETTDESAPAEKPAKAPKPVDITLPPLSDFDDIEVPEYNTSFTRKQGDDKPPRKFSAKGPKADAVMRVLFADQGFTRQQIADIVDCSASRVTECIWALESTLADGPTDWELPDVPRSSKAKAEETADA